MTGNVRACDCLSHTGDRSIDKSSRTEEREKERGKKSPGTKKEGKLSWNISRFLAKLA